ncbi:hypothetical protein V3C99_002391 [Haemonchus contortus]
MHFLKQYGYVALDDYVLRYSVRSCPNLHISSLPSVDEGTVKLGCFDGAVSGFKSTAVPVFRKVKQPFSSRQTNSSLSLSTVASRCSSDDAYRRHPRITTTSTCTQPEGRTTVVG